jgi:hypothetical protein
MERDYPRTSKRPDLLFEFFRMAFVSGIRILAVDKEASCDGTWIYA